MSETYKVGDSLRLYLQRKIPNQPKPSPMPEQIVTVKVIGVESSESAYLVRQNIRDGRMGEGVLTFYGPPAEQWYVIGSMKA